MEMSNILFFILKAAIWKHYPCPCSLKGWCCISFVPLYVDVLSSRASLAYIIYSGLV
jgi:hypothetical protein